MTFGLLKHFKDKDKGLDSANLTTFVKNVIIGEDLASVLKLMELRKASSPEEIKLVSGRPLNKQFLIEKYQYGVTQLRDQSVVEEIYRNKFNAKISSQKVDPQFYKDGKFHDFAGRAKPMELKAGEAIFTQKGYRLDLASLFSEEEWVGLDEILSLHVDCRIMDSIEKTEVSDLVEKSEWKIAFKDYKKITCENLYCSLSPKKFLDLLKSKDQVSGDLIDFCSSAETQAGTSITWIFNKEIFQEERTLLVPQSMTHEWGHFVFEFESFDHGTGVQMCHGLFLVHEEGPQAEDLAGKIKLMKRVFDRVFSDFESHVEKEFIRYDEEMFVSGTKDHLLEQISFDYPTLKFIGQSAPMIPPFTKQKFLARVLLS